MPYNDYPLTRVIVPGTAGPTDPAVIIDGNPAQILVASGLPAVIIFQYSPGTGLRRAYLMGVEQNTTPPGSGEWHLWVTDFVNPLVKRQFIDTLHYEDGSGRMDFAAGTDAPITLTWGPGGASPSDISIGNADTASIGASGELVIGGSPIRSSPISAANPNTGFAESWHNIVWLNSWANRGAGFPVSSYRKIASPPNSVQVTGQATGGVSGSIAFNLPAGYRPLTQITVPIVGTGAVFVINTNGDVQCFFGGTTFLQFSFDFPLDL